MEGTSDVTSILLKKSTCSSDELVNYLGKIDGYKGTNLADEFVSTGNWPDDIQIPKDSSVLKDGNIDWGQVPQGGFKLDAAGNSIKEDYTPFIGEVIDRYGPADGRYTLKLHFLDGMMLQEILELTLQQANRLPML